MSTFVVLAVAGSTNRFLLITLGVRVDRRTRRAREGHATDRTLTGEDMNRKTALIVAPALVLALGSSTSC